MTQILLLSAVIPYAIALLLRLPVVVRGIRDTKGTVFWICAAWVAMFIGQCKFFGENESATNIGSLSSAALYQIFWMAIAFIIVTRLFLRVKFSSQAWRLPVIALLAYSFWGVTTSAFSPAPLFSAYKASLIAMDALLVLMALSVLKERARPEILLDVTYFLIGIVVAAAALGGVLYPTEAFHDIYGGFRGVMHGTIIHIHFNELGLLSAITVVVSVRRAFSSGTAVERIFWTAQAWVGLIVLFNATARTSIASLFVALLALTFLIRQLRPVLVVLILVGIVGGASLWLSNAKLNLDQTDAAAYLRRGSTDEQLKTLSGRIPLWGIGFEMFKDAPFTGHGFAAGTRYAGRDYGLPEGTNMHSAHVAVLVDSGAPGYIFWIIFVMTPAFLLVRRLVSRKYIYSENYWGLHVETTLVMFIIVFRSFLGAVLVLHHFTFLVYCATIIYIYLMSYRQLENVESTKETNRMQVADHILRRKKSAD